MCICIYRYVYLNARRGIPKDCCHGIASRFLSFSLSISLSLLPSPTSLYLSRPFSLRLSLSIAFTLPPSIYTSAPLPLCFSPPLSFGIPLSFTLSLSLPLSSVSNHR